MQLRIEFICVIYIHIYILHRYHSCLYLNNCDPHEELIQEGEGLQLDPQVPSYACICPALLQTLFLSEPETGFGFAWRKEVLSEI